MLFLDKKSYPSFLVPEVVQTSTMDCGPASLKALLEGFGIESSYGRLREACHTDVDGTSIDTLEVIANQAGLDAQQILIPAEHLIRPGNHNLPGIVVVRLPNGNTHFLVVWRIWKNFVQVMDPAKGRRWIPKKEFLQDLYIHRHPIPAETWKNYAFSNRFTSDLLDRMNDLGITDTVARSHIENAEKINNWQSIAKLDAAVRFLNSLVESGGLLRETEAENALGRFLEENNRESKIKIPANYWLVKPIEGQEQETLLVKGAVSVFIKGKKDFKDTQFKDSKDFSKEANISQEQMDKILVKDKESPAHALLKNLKQDGYFTPSIIGGALLITSMATIIEAILLLGLLKIGETMDMPGLKMGAGILFLVFFLGILLSEIFVSYGVARMGRKLEIRLRSAFLAKIPKLGDRYFHSRLTSDMAQRAHELQDIRNLPKLGFGFLRNVFRIIFIAIGIIWLDPGSFVYAIMGSLLAIGVSVVFHPLLVELDLRLVTHNSALSRFYLDSLLGLFPIRTHSAAEPVRSEHESLLVEWVRAGLDLLGSQVLIQFVQALVGTLFSIFILFHYIHSGGEPSGVLLLFYWVLSLPALAQALARYANQYPMYRNRMLRYLEPLTAPEEYESDTVSIPTSQLQAEDAISIQFKNVYLENNGHPILKNLNLEIQQGEHISIVGKSGAGKSSLAGLLLGWDSPTQGELAINGEILEGTVIEDIRKKTVWLDPSIQLWNKSLIDNLKYGSESIDHDQVTEVLESADLFHILEKMPQGMQTKLGESGGLVSGGEGQRVRLGRALLKKSPKLVILDEPFRGLDREKRKQFIKKARTHWSNATLIFISHDISDTRSFDRVLVMNNGELIEDGNPKNLSRRKESKYKDLLAEEKEIQESIWEDKQWKQYTVEQGKILSTQ